MKSSLLSACLLVVFVFGSFHGKAAAFDKDSKLNKTQQMLKAASVFCPKIKECALDAKEYADRKKQEQFCDIMKHREEFENCAITYDGECSKEDVDRLRRVACDEETRFEKVDYAISATSGDCQTALRTCEILPSAAPQNPDQKLCDLFNEEKNGTTPEECAITKGCRSSEFTKVHDVACRACCFTATVMVITMSLILAGIFIC